MLLSAMRQAWAYQGTLANLSPMTLHGRDDRLSRFVAWCTRHGVTEVEAITVPHIHQFLSEFPAQLADSTRNGYARTLRAFMNYCVLEELVPEKLPRRIHKAERPPHEARNECNEQGGNDDARSPGVRAYHLADGDGQAKRVVASRRLPTGAGAHLAVRIPLWPLPSAFPVPSRHPTSIPPR
jgi:hypothetical protein